MRLRPIIIFALATNLSQTVDCFHLNSIPPNQLQPLLNTRLAAVYNTPIIVPDSIETPNNKETTELYPEKEKQNISNISNITMSTAVLNEMIEASVPIEESSGLDSNKRKLSFSALLDEEEEGEPLQSKAAAAASLKPKGLSHSVSFVGGIDVLAETSKGREEYASDIPSNAVNLCSASSGARVLFATDEWFAKADNLLKDSPPEFDEDAYCEQVCANVVCVMLCSMLCLSC